MTINRKNRGKVTAVAGAALLLVGLTGCGSTQTAQSGKSAKTDQHVIKVRLGDTNPETNPEIPSERFFAKRLGELTNGQYQMEVYPNATLGPHDSMNEQCQAGTLQFTTSDTAELASFDKRLSIFSLPYVFDSREKLFAAEDGKLGQAYNTIAEQKGFKILAYFDSGSRNIYNKKGPIKSPSDITNMHLRLRTIPNDVMIATINAMGAQAVPLGAPEVYNAIQQGVVDGAENSITLDVASKHYEVASYFSVTNHFWSVDVLMVSSKWFNAQPPEIQKAIVQAGAETEKFEREAWAKGEDENMKKAKSLGVKINDDVDIPAFKKLVKPVWDKYGPDMGELFQILKDSQ